MFLKHFAFKKNLSKFSLIFTHLTEDEKLKLYNLSSSLSQGSVIVELGSYLGASSSFLALGAKHNKSNVYCVDTWQNDEMSEGLRDTYSEFLRNTKPVSKYIEPHRGLSIDIAIHFDKKIDMIFFDGGHSYETVKSDWDAWSPKLKIGSLVVFHDIGWADGVKKVVNENVEPLLLKHEQSSNMYWGIIK